MSNYRNNHYVPIWYQERFISSSAPERKFYYLDLNPETKRSGLHIFKRKSILRWGPASCFCQKDLYTTQLGTWISTEIEERFFGPIDEAGRRSLDYFANFAHPTVDYKAYREFLNYLSLQKLRTPKGLRYLASLVPVKDNNSLLIALQRYQNIFCANWAESVWSIIEADGSLPFLLSDHPVTVYNSGCFPASKWCRDGLDPHVWLTGSHTLFPLRSDRLLILTNLSWVRYPYGDPTKPRPNPSPFRNAVFKFTDVQTGRKVTDQEVALINHIIKSRALRYVAAEKKEALFPEAHVKNARWDTFGKQYLLMPDPRSVDFTTEVWFGYKDGHSEGFDEYGRRPSDANFTEKRRMNRDWETFHAFQGEFARIFGPKRRGVCYMFGAMGCSEDTAELHRYHLGLENKYRKHKV